MIFHKYREIYTAQAYDRRGLWNAEGTFGRLRRRIIAECKAGHLWGPLYMISPYGRESDMTPFFVCYGLRTDNRPEPMIDEDEEAVE